ncbi:aminopeptidase O isoform X2 [Denticeps clupeoides]|uniref:aminopeptidase O isoform X2 n=1 Tax=Denticeps clupeoides TaxID=299321 RepID=UPI0010A36D2D|nr:aminopeptidase O isoform X2 [Denticeps clupeoides]
MEPDKGRDQDPTKDDLPLRANTSHMLVRHYVLDLVLNFETEVISGCITLFLEPGKGAKTLNDLQQIQPLSAASHDLDEAACEERPEKTSSDSRPEQGDTDMSWSENETCEDFILVLDCCDLSVLRVEEVDVASVAAMRSLFGDCEKFLPLDRLSLVLVERLLALPASFWQRQHELYLKCCQAPPPKHAEPLLFHTDQWSLQIRKKGVTFPQDFPTAIKIWYHTSPQGGSVRWTQAQDGSSCVYTMGSPINNRALFPCQEPPVAMSTWQASVRAPSEFVVLLSGENQASPMSDETGLACWSYYVTMPMPASTFTLAVGQWTEARLPGTELGTSMSGPSMDPTEKKRNQDDDLDEGLCSHMEYPCRFATVVTRAQNVIPHRVYAPSGLLQKVESHLLPLLPACLEAAYSLLGVHPFSRLDVLIVPAGFASMGMASPHIIFLSQSVLSGDQQLCGSQLCHETAHSWFGLAIGARDWTEEWMSEGFAAFLEDVLWARVAQLSVAAEEEYLQVKALLRWRRLCDELQNSQEQLQVLRPNKENTGQVRDSGASVVKHALNPEKTFMQVHYLKGYFLLKYLSSYVGQEQFLSFLRLFVKRYHGQLVLSQDFLRMFFDHFPDITRKGLTLEIIYAEWLDTAETPKWLYEESAVWLQAAPVRVAQQEVEKWIPFVRGRGKGSKRKRTEPKENFKEMSPDQKVLFLELLLQEEKMSVSSLRTLERTYTLNAQDAEAMGVYLYGELMLNEDGQQQALARRCFSLTQKGMDPAVHSVVKEMIL